MSKSTEHGFMPPLLNSVVGEVVSKTDAKEAAVFRFRF